MKLPTKIKLTDTFDATKLNDILVRPPDFLKGLQPPELTTVDRQVIPFLFVGEGAIIDWKFYAKTPQQKAALNQAPGSQALERAAHLRWTLHSYAGMPTEPFKVWRRKARLADATPLDPPAEWSTAGGITTVKFQKPLSKLYLWFEAGPAGAAVSALRGTPILSGAELPHVAAANSTALITVSSPQMIGVSFVGISKLLGAAGVTTDAYAALPDWTMVETVGLPTSPELFAELPGWTGKQGLGEVPTQDPESAAADRLLRGGPPFGWPDLMAAGIAAPPWEHPSIKATFNSITAEKTGILHHLRDAMLLPQTHQRKHRIVVDVPEVTADGTIVPPGTAGVSALGVAQLAASTDPYLALMLGLGTALADTSGGSSGGGVNTNAVLLRHERFDYMVTARFAHGLFGGGPLELAAPIPEPGPALVPFAPTHLTPWPSKFERPAIVDDPWRVGVRLEWDRTPRNSIYTIASAAGARAGAIDCEPILDPRPGGGFRPIAATPGKNADGTIPNVVALRDPGVDVVSSPVTQQWGVTQQTTFGIWSAWTTAQATLTPPDAQIPVIAAVRLEAEAGDPGAATCPGTLVVELLLDWAVRSPRDVTFVGRIFAAASRNAKAPDPSRPTGLDRGTGIGGPALILSFAGDVPSASGAVIVPLDPDSSAPLVDPGSGLVTAWPTTPVRRYRISLPGLPINFSQGHAVAQVWAMSNERIATQRGGEWTRPSRGAASDPRPPVPAAKPVPPLGSMPDAQGRSHARIAWESGSAVGTLWTVYEADEMSILAAAKGLPRPGVDPKITDAEGRPEPGINASLVDRLETLTGIEYDGQVRSVFTRRDGGPIAGNSIDVALPRGSSVFHAFIVQGTSAGGVASDWPSSSAQVRFVYPPKVAAPAPPILQVSAGKSGVRIRIEPRPGVAAVNFDVYRTRIPDAARQLTLMGPPIAKIATGEPGATLETTDSPPGAWERWWYRAAGWSQTDATRGRLGARGEASIAVSVLVPPEGPPPLANVAVVGAGKGKIAIHFTSAIPTKPTPLGAHRIGIEIVAAAGSINVAVDEVVAGLERHGNDFVYTLAAPNAAALVEAVVRITDPLGRVAEKAVTLGVILKPVPVLVGAKAELKAGNTAFTLAVPGDVLKGSAGQTLMVDWESKVGDEPIAIALKDVPAGKVRTLPGGAQVRRTGDRGSFVGLEIMLPGAARSLDVSLAGRQGESISRKVPVRW